MRNKWLVSALLVVALGYGAAVQAEETTYTIIEKDKKFSPQELVVPKGQKIKLIIKNQDSTPAEFESSDLNREKLVGANSDITVYVGPLEVGSYGYFDDFHRDATTGKITAQ